jgi:DNA-binding XRE family transcriptional regulator
MESYEAEAPKGATLGERIANIRMTDDERAMLKRQMKAVDGVAQASYYHWLSGKCDPPVRVAIAWAEILGVTVEVLLSPVAYLPNPFLTNDEARKQTMEGGSHE